MRLLSLALLALLCASSALALDFDELPGGGGGMYWIEDGSGDATPGSVAAGGGSNVDLVAWDAENLRWILVTRRPAAAETPANTSPIGSADAVTLGTIVGLEGATTVQEALEILASEGDDTAAAVAAIPAPQGLLPTVFVGCSGGTATIDPTTSTRWTIPEAGCGEGDTVTLDPLGALPASTDWRVVRVFNEGSTSVELSLGSNSGGFAGGEQTLSPYGLAEFHELGTNRFVVVIHSGATPP